MHCPLNAQETKLDGAVYELALFLCDFGPCLAWILLLWHGQLDLLNPLEGTDRGKKEGQVGHGWEDREHYLELALHEEKLLLTTVI